MSAEPASNFSVGMRGMSTGRARKAAETRGTIGISQPGDTGRPEGDFYRTPSSATEALPEYLPPHDLRYGVWEPAAGDGAIADVLRARGGGEGGDERLLPPRRHAGRHGLPADANAAGAERHHQPALQARGAVRAPRAGLGATNVALLLRLAFLEGQRRTDLWPNLDRVLVFSKRLTLWRGDHERAGESAGGMIAFAWFLWRADGPAIGVPTIHWIKE